jgi:hypothetical protein
MLHAIEMGWFLINKYYHLTDEAPVYAAALLLDPSKRAAYMKQNWADDWIHPSITAATQIWVKDYESYVVTGSEDISESMPPPPKRPRNELDRLLKEIAVKPTVSTDLDNFTVFINASPIALDEGCTPLRWWSHPIQRLQYPRLHRMAIAILSIPAESAEPERTFSGARRTCQWDRLRITCENIEIIECLGNWLKQGLVIPLFAGGRGLFVSPPLEIDIDSEDDEIAASIE